MSERTRDQWFLCQRRKTSRDQAHRERRKSNELVPINIYTDRETINYLRILLEKWRES